ncbi:MAG: DNA polymerase subunit beta [Cyanobacteria bacterium QS_8_64_29]|nr:MAG: DNA polymerase subunit beta [Cyanobacteria bacterium QS_8_64_29]
MPLLERHREQLAELCRRYHVAQLEVFGSAAEGEADADARDIDLLVEFADAPNMGPADRYFGLLAELQTLLNRPVDLVCADAMRNPYFIREVNRSRSPLYAA